MGLEACMLRGNWRLKNLGALLDPFVAEPPFNRNE